MMVRYQEYEIRVPEPEAFVLLKLLVIPRRKNPGKIEKDAYAARSLGGYLLEKDDRRTRLKDIFSDLPNGWKKKIRSAAKVHFPNLLDYVH